MNSLVQAVELRSLAGFELGIRFDGRKKRLAAGHELSRQASPRARCARFSAKSKSRHRDPLFRSISCIVHANSYTVG